MIRSASLFSQLIAIFDRGRLGFHKLVVEHRAERHAKGLFRSDVLTSKIVFFEGLKQLLGRAVFFEVVIDQEAKLLFEVHLQRPVASGSQLWRIFYFINSWLHEIVEVSGFWQPFRNWPSRHA